MRAWIRVGLVALLWGSTFLWTELALRGLSPVQVTVVRSALGALVLTAACYAARHRLPRGWAVWRHILVAAFFCNALPFSLFSLGQQYVDSGLAGVLNATTPLWAWRSASPSARSVACTRSASAASFSASPAQS